jgi:hypothetical protein
MLMHCVLVYWYSKTINILPADVIACLTNILANLLALDYIIFLVYTGLCRLACPKLQRP